MKRQSKVSAHPRTGVRWPSPSVAVLLWLLAGAGNAQPVDVFETDLATLAAAQAEGRVTALALVDQYLARIAAYDRAGPQLNAVLRVNPQARAQAAALDAERAAGQVRGPLHGIPVVIKDNYNTDWMPTTGASVALADWIPNANATAVQRLLDVGAVILAKTNLHEFAYGITSISSLGGQTRNPYDPRRLPGGSSGGTAAAVAASLAAVGMGSDTCGSIRIPSAYNGLVGLRPTKGLTSIHGIMPLSHTQDVIGPLARTVGDLARVLDVVAGVDPADPATAALATQTLPGFVASLDSVPLQGLRVGKLMDYFSGVDPAAQRVIDAALAAMQAAGVTVVEVSLPDLAALTAASGLIGQEFRPDLDAYLATFGSTAMPDLRTIVDLGLHHSAVAGLLRRSAATEPDPAAVANAMAQRQALAEAVAALLTQHDLDGLLYPPIRSLPAWIGDSQPGSNCALSAQAGLPAMAFPVGFTPDGLPVGVELLGPAWSDTDLVSIAWQWEQLASPRQPPVTTPPLVNGAAPPPERRSVNLAQGSLVVMTEFSRDVTTGTLSWQVINRSEDPQQVHALVLTLQPDADDSNPAVTVERLLAPGTVTATGEMHLTPTLHQAWQEQRLQVRLFADGLGVEGIGAGLRP